VSPAAGVSGLSVFVGVMGLLMLDFIAVADFAMLLNPFQRFLPQNGLTGSVENNVFTG